MRKYFHIFLGAAVIRNGLPSIQEWVSALIDYSLPSATNVAIDGNNVANMNMAVNVSPPLDPFKFYQNSKRANGTLGQYGKSRLINTKSA